MRTVRETIADLPNHLNTLWRDAGFAPREKRRIVCLLWAEVNVDQPDAQGGRRHHELDTAAAPFRQRGRLQRARARDPRGERAAPFAATMMRFGGDAAV